MLKISTLALFSANIYCTTSLGTYMPPWSIGNALVVKRHTVSILAVMSPKDGVFCIGLYGGSALARFLLFILCG